MVRARARRVWPTLAAGGLLVFSVAAAAAGDLTVEVAGVRSSDGFIQVAVYDDETAFLDQDLVGRIIPAVAGVTVVRFPGLPGGSYAIAAFHDENGNRRFDKAFLGLPAEGYGFSNDVRPFLGPPPFEGAAFALGDTGATTARFKLVYP